MLAPLEDRFARPDTLPAHVDGIVVLGGYMNGDINAGRKGFELNSAADRIFEAIRLARLYPDARVVISGERVVSLRRPFLRPTVPTRCWAIWGFRESAISMKTNLATRWRMRFFQSVSSAEAGRNMASGNFGLSCAACSRLLSQG